MENQHHHFRWRYQDLGRLDFNMAKNKTKSENTGLTYKNASIGEVPYLSIEYKKGVSPVSILDKNPFIKIIATPNNSQ